MCWKILWLFWSFMKNIFNYLSACSTIRSSSLSLKSKNWKSIWLAKGFVSSHLGHSLSQLLHRILNFPFVWRPGNGRKTINSKRGCLFFQFLLEYSCFIMFVSPVLQSESVIRMHPSPVFWIFFPYRSPEPWVESPVLQSVPIGYPLDP